MVTSININITNIYQYAFCNKTLYSVSLICKTQMWLHSLTSPLRIKWSFALPLSLLFHMVQLTCFYETSLGLYFHDVLSKNEMLILQYMWYLPTNRHLVQQCKSVSRSQLLNRTSFPKTLKWLKFNKGKPNFSLYLLSIKCTYVKSIAIYIDQS